MKRNITLDQIAGYVTERTVWQLLLDLSDYCSDGELFGVTANDIIVSDSSFSLDKHRGSIDNKAGNFSSPESFHDVSIAKNEASCIWTLGALAFYAITGMDVLEGKGGCTQNKDTNIPRISSAYATEQLSALIRQCLSYSPSERPSRNTILLAAKDALEKPASPRKRLITNNGRSYCTSIVKFWPEEMVPLLAVCVLLLSSLSMSAQNGAFDRTSIPNEMVNLVMRCIDLRSSANIEKVRNLLREIAIDISEQMNDACTQRLSKYFETYINELNHEKQRLVDIIDGNTQKYDIEIGCYEEKIRDLDYTVLCEKE